MRIHSLILTVTLLALPLALVRAQEKPAPKADAPLERNAEAKLPTRPEKGPGSAEYAHRSVEVAEAGEGGKHYWVYTPAEPRPKDAPVVCFVHGFGALRPDNYVDWVHHICKRGNIVVYPQYQENIAEPAANFAPNSAHGVLDAIKWLREDKTRVQPREADFAIVGHSAGGVTTANLAADWEALKLPKPKAAMPVQPGRAFSYKSEQQKNGLIPLSDFSKIPETCLLLGVYSDSDETVGAWCARKIFADASKVKTENKNLVEMRTTAHAGRMAVAGHRIPGAPKDTADFFDWYGTWKLFDGLCDAAFHGKNREFALGNTEQQRFMGKCSDGRPATEMRVWLGDAKIDVDAEYNPAYNRRGEPVKAPEKKPAETPKEEGNAPEVPKPEK